MRSTLHLFIFTPGANNRKQFFFLSHPLASHSPTKICARKLHVGNFFANKILVDVSTFTPCQGKMRCAALMEYAVILGG